MTIYTFSEARQNFAAILEKAKGWFLLRSSWCSKRIDRPGVEGADIGITASEVVDILRGIRELASWELCANGLTFDSLSPQKGNTDVPKGPAKYHCNHLVLSPTAWLAEFCRQTRLA
jgi:hypothetical protein